MEKQIAIAILTITFYSKSIGQQTLSNIVSGVNALFQGHVSQTLGLVPGHVIRIEKPGEWVYENSAGLAPTNPSVNTQANMKFKMARVTKMFTCPFLNLFKMDR